MSNPPLVAALSLTLFFAWAASSFAQGTQTGTVRGTVLDSQQLALPGVTVTVRSNALQGVRTTFSGGTGSYQLLGLPPGVYTVTFQLDGFGDVEEQAAVPLGGTIGVNATMAPAGLAETVQVVAVIPSAIESTETSYNLTATDINQLPVGRNLFLMTELAPGLTANTPNRADRQVTISGAFAYDNVFLLDGVDIADNVFGTPNNVFIEDAIEETNVLTSGISSVSET